MCAFEKLQLPKGTVNFLSHQSAPPGGGGGDSHIKRTGCSSYFLGVKKAILVLPKALSLKRSTAGAFALLFRVLSRKKKWEETMCCFRIGTSLEVKNISGHAHKIGSWYLLGVLFKISDEHPCSFYMGAPGDPGAASWDDAIVYFKSGRAPGHLVFEFRPADWPENIFLAN